MTTTSSASVPQTLPAAKRAKTLARFEALLDAGEKASSTGGKVTRIPRRRRRRKPR